MNVELTHGQKQLVLLSKGHYGTRSLNKIKALVAWDFKIPVNTTELDHIYSYVLKVFILLQDVNRICDTYEFLSGLFTAQRPTITFEIMIEIMLGEIAFVEKCGLNLGQVDEDLIRELNVKVVENNH